MKKILLTFSLLAAIPTFAADDSAAAPDGGDTAVFEETQSVETLVRAYTEGHESYTFDDICAHVRATHADATEEEIRSALSTILGETLGEALAQGVTEGLGAAADDIRKSKPIKDIVEDLKREAKVVEEKLAREAKVAERKANEAAKKKAETIAHGARRVAEGKKVKIRFGHKKKGKKK